MSVDPNEINRLARLITEDPNVPADDHYGDDEDEDEFEDMDVDERHDNAQIWEILTYEQTHPTNRGYAPSDNVYSEGYHVLITNEQEKAEIAHLLKLVEAKAQKEIRARVERWQANHPGQEETEYQGEEFVGHRWVVDHGCRNWEDGDRSDTSATEMIAVLRSMLDSTGE